MRVHRAMLLRVFDLAATFVFAVEGAQAAAVAGLDLLGLLVLAFSTALVGGLIRDVLLGELPPAALRSVEYPVIAFAGAGVVFLLFQVVESLPSWVGVGADAVGLSLFAVTGAVKALDHRTNPLTAVLLGVVTATGGGVVRDVLLGEVPRVLRGQIYASAALVGGVVVVVALRLGARRPVAMILGATACFVLRIVSVWLSWGLPSVAT